MCTKLIVKFDKLVSEYVMRWMKTTSACPLGGQTQRTLEEASPTHWEKTGRKEEAEVR